MNAIDPDHGDERADLVVIGSGAAGLGAAVSAAHLGRRVVVLEKSSSVGGTTAFSGALLWAPLHHKRVPQDPPDTRERAIEYILHSSGPCDRSLVEAYVDSAAETLAFLERATPLRLVDIAYPDTFAEAPAAPPAAAMSSRRCIRCASPEAGKNASAPRRRCSR